jgi:hypothetical protein
MQRIALLESEKKGSRTAGGSAASVALHVAVLAFAIALTAHSGMHSGRTDPIYIPLPHWHPEVRNLSQTASHPVQTVASRVPAISVAVPSVIPVVIPPPAMSAALPTAIGAPSAPTSPSRSGTDTTTAVPRGDAPFASEEVDVAASVFPNQRGPVYPEALRMIGVEGRVVARFIIGKNGRVENDPTILLATDDQFATAVRRYLATARYRAATKNGEPVRQLAEQEFDFAVRR